MQDSGGDNCANKKMKREISSIMSEHDESFKAISKSQVALTAALLILSSPGG